MHIGRIWPAIEINRPSLSDPFAAGAMAILADNGANAGAVLGQPIEIAVAALAEVRVSVGTGTGELARGGGVQVMGNPVRSLTWFLAEAVRRDLPVRSGDIVLSGSMTPPFEVHPGDRIEADFGAHGVVVAELETNGT